MLWDETAFQDLLIFFRYEPVICMSIAYLFNFLIALETLFQYISKTLYNLFKLCHDRGNQGRYIQAPLSDFWKHSMGGVKLSFFIVQIGSSSHFNDFYRGFLLVYLEFSRFRRQNQVELQDFAGRITANSSTPPYCCSDSNSVKLLYLSSDIRRNVPIGEEQGETAVFAG